MFKHNNRAATIPALLPLAIISTFMWPVALQVAVVDGPAQLVWGFPIVAFWKGPVSLSLIVRWAAFPLNLIIHLSAIWILLKVCSLRVYELKALYVGLFWLGSLVAVTIVAASFSLHSIHRESLLPLIPPWIQGVIGYEFSPFP